MHPIQDLFLEYFSYVLQIDMHFICTPMWTEFYSCKKWVLQKHMVILADVVSGCITFSEAPCLAWKCGTHRSDSHVRAMYSTTPRLW
jgi:hypothetical protein